jgi:hypothetical protein
VLQAAERCGLLAEEPRQTRRTLASGRQVGLAHPGRPAHRTPPRHRDIQQREAALALGVRVAIHDSRQNDRSPVIWLAGQDYRTADAIQAAHRQPTRTRRGPERVGPER